MGMVVIVAALDGDFQRKPFGKICELVPKSESVTKLSAVALAAKIILRFTQRTAVIPLKKLSVVQLHQFVENAISILKFQREERFQLLKE